MDKTILKVENISKTYSGITVLNNVSFELKKGEVHALIGENGAGKSTLIKIIAGVVQPDEGGKIFIDNVEMDKLNANKSIEMGVNVIYQDISLFPNLTVAENICIGNDKSFLTNWKKMREIAQEKIDQMGVEIDLDVKLEDISIGKQQLVAIARAITFESKIIIMDEPTAALSSSEVGMLYNIVETIKKQGVGIIYISHKLDEVFTVADRITVLRDGNMVSSDIISEFDNQKLINLMVGRELRFIPMHNEEDSNETIFEVKDMTCEPLFRDISFKLKKHEILGITGLVGAGRSELAQAIFGLRKAQKGELCLENEKISIDSPNDSISLGIAYLPEDRRVQGLFEEQSMVDNLTVSKLDKTLNKLNLISRKKEIEITKEYIEKMDIRPKLPNINVENMSGGNQQKVLLSRWLNTNPRVLIVDEPTSGVDVGAKLEIHKLLRELAKSGVGVILISSDLPEVFAVSDRILVMRRGNLVYGTKTSETTQEIILEKELDDLGGKSNE